MRKHKSVIMAMAIVLAIATIASASTFAWYTAADSKVNQFRNKQWNPTGIKIGEDFDPPKEWTPGTKIEKKVWAINVSDSDSIVRITLAEMLLYLDSAMTVTTSSTPYASTVPTGMVAGNDFAYAGLKVPQVGSPNFYATSSDWHLLGAGTVAAEALIDSTSSFSPISGVDIYYKLTTTTDPYDSSIITNIEMDLVAFSKVGASDLIGKYYTNDSYQIVDLSGAVTKAKGTGTVPTLVVTLTPGSIRYNELTMGTTATGEWLDPSTSLAAPYNTWTNRKLIGTAITAAPGASVSNIDALPLIELYFSSFVSTTPTAGEWWYNATDGCFYFMQIVLSGDDTAQFLDYVALNGPAAKNWHSDLAYDLIIFAEAIQPSKAAVTGEWGAAVETAFAAAGVPLTA